MTGMYRADADLAPGFSLWSPGSFLDKLRDLRGDELFVKIRSMSMSYRGGRYMLVVSSTGEVGWVNELAVDTVDE